MDLEIEWSPTDRLNFRDIILFIAEIILWLQSNFEVKY